jgi:peptide/nickel transport system ATP-binding protein
MATSLDVRGLTVELPTPGGWVRPVNDVSFTLGEGETLGIVGESGSGKTLLSLALMGLEPHGARHRGEAWLNLRGAGTGNGKNGGAAHGAQTGAQGGARAGRENLLGISQNEMRELRGREIAMIFQEPMTALNPVMTIGRQVAESVQAHAPSCTRSEAKNRAIAALEEVAISDAAARFGDFPHQFSGGQRQRILIAMALINRPRLLIADEPTTALDVTVQAQVLTLLGDLQRQHGLAMLFISHDLAVVGQVAGRVAVMRAGQVVETGSCTNLLTAPQHAYTQSLLRAVPTLRTDREQPLAMVDIRG